MLKTRVESAKMNKTPISKAAFLIDTPLATLRSWIQRGHVDWSSDGGFDDEGVIRLGYFARFMRSGLSVNASRVASTSIVVRRPGPYCVLSDGSVVSVVQSEAFFNVITKHPDGFIVFHNQPVKDE